MRGTTGRRARTAEDEVLALVQEHAAELLRFAHRFSLCADDAHDAYQRTIEILMRRMRTAPPQHPLNWLRSVVRNEALAVRAQREQLVSRLDVDLDRHAAHDAEDPCERAVGFERVRHTAEALQRLKPQETTALVLRAEGLSYREICARMGWTYTRTNRCVTEGRRALLERLGAIESGAECERWLPLLSRLADGEASAAELADLRPHLRSCAACRSTLRRVHDAPGEVAALVPIVLVGSGGGVALARHAQALAHALSERASLVALRVQGALDALPGAKLAAVAASGAAIAGGGVAIEHAAQPPDRAVPAARAAVVRAGVSAPAGPLATSRPRDRAPAARPSGRPQPPPDGAARAASEFTLEPAGVTAPAASPSAHAASTPRQSPPAEFAGP